MTPIELKSRLDRAAASRDLTTALEDVVGAAGLPTLESAKDAGERRRLIAALLAAGRHSMANPGSQLEAKRFLERLVKLR